MSKIKQPSNADEFDAYFEDNDISDLLDTKSRRINVDMPATFLFQLDQKAKLLGVSRQSLVKLWLAEKLNIV